MSKRVPRINVFNGGFNNAKGIFEVGTKVAGDLMHTSEVLFRVKTWQLAVGATLLLCGGCAALLYILK